MTMLTRCTECGTTFRITTEQLVSHQGKVRCGSCGIVFSALGNLLHGREPPMEPVSAAPGPILPAGLATPSLTTAEVTLEAPTSEASPSAGSAGMPPSGETAAVPVPAAVSAPARRPRPWASLAGALIAATALAAQAVYFYRNEVAGYWPEAKPWLVQMCQAAACRLDTPRDPQSLSIESSDLQAHPANRGVLTLTALLRNRAGFAQDAPHLELTLTDAQDALVVRRVLAPRDYFATPTIGAGTETQVRVLIDAGQLKASGYRLYAFYP